MATGRLEIKYTELHTLISDINDCEYYYENKCDHLQEVINSINCIDREILPDGGQDLDNAISRINRQIDVYNSKSSALESVRDNFNQFILEAEEYENRIANHLDSNFGEFCRENNIKVDDPDDYDFWDFIDDLGDSIREFYEEYKYIVDVIIDAVIFAAATVAVIVAVGTLMAVTGGALAVFMAVAGVVAAGFELYEAATNMIFSSAALVYHLQGNEEGAKSLSEIRDDGAGKYVFVEIVTTVPFVSEEAATSFYQGMSLGAALFNFANSAYTVGSGFIAGWKNGNSTMQKLWNGVKEIFKTNTPNRFNINEDAFDDTFAIWMVLDDIGIDPSIKTLENMYKGSFILDQVSGYVENINDYLNDESDKVSNINGSVMNVLGTVTGWDVVDLESDFVDLIGEISDSVELIAN